MDEQWNKVSVCENTWLKSKSTKQEKRILKEKFCVERKVFDRLNRKYKPQFQLEKQRNLSNLCNSNRNDFWKEIGKLGVGNDRKLPIPMEIKSEDGSVNTNVNDVLNRWEFEYRNLFSVNDSDSFDNDHLLKVQNNLRNIVFPNSYGLLSQVLNSPIRKAIEKAKVKKAAG